jgi:glucose uptake protein GlcU
MKKEKKLRKETTMKENMGKLLLDLGKLIVGGVIIGGILRSEISQVILIICGSVVAIIFFIYGLFMTMKEKNEKKE